MTDTKPPNTTTSPPIAPHDQAQQLAQQTHLQRAAHLQQAALYTEFWNAFHADIGSFADKHCTL